MSQLEINFPGHIFLYKQTMGKQGYVLFIVEDNRGRHKTGENKQIQKFIISMKCSEMRCSFKLFS